MSQDGFEGKGMQEMRRRSTAGAKTAFVPGAVPALAELKSGEAEDAVWVPGEGVPTPMHSLENAGRREAEFPDH